MDHDTFKHLISAYGSQSENWPDDVRNAALNFQQSHPDVLTDILAEEAKLDSFLDRAKFQPGVDLLKQRIISDVRRDAALSQTHTSYRPGWKAVAAMLAVTFSFGFLGGQFFDDFNTVETAEDTQIAQTEYLGLSDVYEWVYEEG